MKYQTKNIWYLIIIFSILLGCKENYEEPEVSLDAYQIENGFELSVVAAEPFLEAPVTIDFDIQGRMWVAEMRGYMTNIDGEGENLPSGTISIMEDLDGDGVTDHSKIFLDGLILPRALALVYNGLLYAEPPNLWFVEIIDDKPGKKILIDSLYADDGNVEHQPNGLMMNIDNWIYNAKSYFRYQRKNGVWIKEPTSYRGQWGITKDNFGRIYHNNNSTLLQGDFVLPNITINNPYFRPQESIGQLLTSNQRVYPLHVTSVNRGYEKDVLDADSMLRNTTSACGPVVYRAGQFPNDYNENVFVCVPEANLIKRHILSFDQIQTTGEQAWDNKEFLASTDEAFRPVNLFNGPDGAMYIVDMHRGIIQHGAYMSPYLRKHLEKKGLDKIIGMGRILKVINEAQPLLSIPDLVNATNASLVEMLQHKNGWVRDKAQHLLVLNGTEKEIPLLEKTALNFDDSIGQMHALHTLNGLDHLRFDLLIEVANTSKSTVVAHTLTLLQNFNTDNHNDKIKALSEKLIAQDQPVVDLYLINALSKWSEGNQDLLPLLKTLLDKHQEPIYAEMLLSKVSGREEEFIDLFPNNDNLKKLLQATLENREIDKKNWIFEAASLEEDDRTRGLRFYKNICAACHGLGGNGIDGLAPPLRDSEFLSGSGKRLALILLHGLKGPIHVDGKLYNFNAPMPGIKENTQLSDQDISDLITYLSNAFGRSARDTNAEIIRELREAKPTSGDAYTEEELLKIKF